jgi:hypothetical protein
MDSMRIAVVGSGIAGLSAAWLLSQRHDVTLFEKSSRLGGHANTVEIAAEETSIPVDTGFIVYNEQAYPNLTALFQYLDVPTANTNMTFSVSLDNGAYEYSGSGLRHLFGQWKNLASIAQWRLTADIVRFFSKAPRQVELLPEEATLGEFLVTFGYSKPFVDRHLLPMAGAIWSAAPGRMSDYPARAFIRFFANHGLLKLVNRPAWRTVAGGSREYVNRLVAESRFRVATGAPVESIRRLDEGVVVSARGSASLYDHVVIAAHADEALAMLSDADTFERMDLTPFAYSRNRAVLHTDEGLMPRRRSLWSSWNYLGRVDEPDPQATVTYWMNSLQPLATRQNVFVTLNPRCEPRPETVIRTFDYEHPVFSPGAMAAQRRIWRLQGRRRTWFCGAHFGSGFHEDGIQSGLAVAEQLGGLRRPWSVANESGRIHIKPVTLAGNEGVREAAE